MGCEWVIIVAVEMGWNGLHGLLIPITGTTFSDVNNSTESVSKLRQHTGVRAQTIRLTVFFSLRETEERQPLTFKRIRTDNLCANFLSN